MTDTPRSPLHVPRTVGFALGGGVASPVAATGYLLAVGYGRDAAPAAALASSAALLFAFALLGAGLGVAFACGLRVAPALAVAATLALPHAPLFAGPPPGPLGAFTGDAVFTTVGFALVAAVEFGLGHPDAVRRALPPETRRGGVAGGVAAVAVVLGVHLALGLGWVTDGPLFTVVATVWTLGGTFLVGSVVGVLWSRAGLLTPAAVVLLVGAVGAYDAWQFASSDAAGVGPTLLTLALAGWFVPLGVALLAGAVEFAGRTSGVGGG